MIEKYLQREVPCIAALPALIWQLMFFILPFLVVCFMSVFPDVSLTAGLGSFSLANYNDVLTFLYLKTILNSLVLAFCTGGLSLLFCFPIASFIAFKIKKHRMFFLILFMLPSWTNFVVRIYSWFFLLGQDGFAANFLVKVGLIGSSDQLLANNFSVMLGMLHSFFPFMLVPLYNSFSKIDFRLIEASFDLGATRYQTLRRVIIPLSWSGGSLGFLSVVISAFGEFAIPELLGGGKSIFWGNVVVTKFLYLADYSLGAATLVVGIICLSSVILLLRASFFCATVLMSFVRNYLYNKLFVKGEA